jgi:hypothetical protein
VEPTFADWCCYTAGWNNLDWQWFEHLDASVINLNELGPVYSRMVVSAFIGAILCVALGLLGLRQLYVGVLADKARTSLVVAFVGCLLLPQR